MTVVVGCVEVLEVGILMADGTETGSMWKEEETVSLSSLSATTVQLPEMLVFSMTSETTKPQDLRSSETQADSERELEHK